MTYIILCDTFGNGLETISDIGVDVIEKHELNDYICAAADIVANEEGYESVSEYIKESRICMGETLVICEIVEELKGKSVDTYILDVLKEQEEKQNSEDYQLYLKLKEKFEK
jgi:threonine dehydratase